MASMQPNKSHQISVRLEPQIHHSLRAIAKRMGVKPAVLSGLAIGQYVSQQEAQFNASTEMQEKIVTELSTVMEKQFGLLMSPEVLEKLLDEDT